MIDDEEHRDIESIPDNTARAIELFAQAVRDGPRDRSTILVELNNTISRYGLTLTQMRRGTRWG